MGIDRSLTPAFLSCPVLPDAEETLPVSETIQASKISRWPENLVDFDDIGDSGDDDDGFPDHFSGTGNSRKSRIKSAPVKREKTVPVPFKMTIRFNFFSSPCGFQL